MPPDATDGGSVTLEIERARVGRRPFTVVELDLDYCDLNYGIAPCTAALGGTGTVKCYNTRVTCQDAAHYTPSAKTYRFCDDIGTVPRQIDAVPCIRDVQLTPTRLQIGRGLGERAKASIVLRDFKHNDRGIDKYVDERTYNPLTQGTFLGRLAARNPYTVGRVLRIKTGYLVQNPGGAWVFDAANFETRTYFIETITPPDLRGSVTIVAKDLLKFADDERAVCPKPSRGRLLAGINAVATSATLTPEGIGDLSYALTGRLRINGEVMGFSRVGDALTLTRAQSNTAAAEHAADDLVQQGYVVDAKTLDLIFTDLLTNFAGVPAAYIPAAEWADEVTTYMARNYSAEIFEPTGVTKLLGELCQVGPCYHWWDERRALLILRALRPASSAAITLTDESNFIKGSLAIKDRLDLRISQSAVTFGLRNPTEPLDQASNYTVSHVEIGDGEGVHKYGQPHVDELFTRWLPSIARVFASEIASAKIQRYNDAPKEVGFLLAPKDSGIWLGDLFRMRSRLTPGPDGAPKEIVLQVLEARPVRSNDQVQYLALEERYSPSETAGTRTVVVSADELDFNLRTRHDQIYPAPTEAVTVVCIIETVATVGSTSTATPGFDVGSWPDGSLITLRLKGRIQGAGGTGGMGGNGVGGPSANGIAGSNGGIALLTARPITIDAGTGNPEIFGGGGGGGGGGAGFNTESAGGGGGGGGGAGSNGGAGGVGGPGEGAFSLSSDGNDGDANSGGGGGSGGGGAFSGVLNDGGAGGAGGGPGLSGSNGIVGGDGVFGPPGNGGAGGTAGPAIDGYSFITFIGSADIRGSQVN